MIPVTDIHIARLDPADDEAAGAWLSPDEESRALRFRRQNDAAIWRSGRAWVRRRLAAALDVPEPAIVIETSPRGRPLLRGAPPGFDANWSHSGSWIALALNRHGPVGIDIETERADFPHHDVIPTVCTPAERAALAAADDLAVRRLFLRIWTAKEALMKATGMGVALDPATIDVSLHLGLPVAYASHPAWRLQSRESDHWIAAWAWAA